MTTIILQPKDIIPDHFKQILALIIKGGQVSRDKLQNRILRADLVAYMVQNDQVICTATLKKPYSSYRSQVFNQAKANIVSDNFKELGYIVTHPDHEGKRHCQELLKIFFKKIDKYLLYATTRKPSMIHILKKFGFSQVGEKYKGDLILLIYNSKSC